MFVISMQTALLIYTVCFFIGAVFSTYYYLFVEQEREELVYIIIFNITAVLGSILTYYRNDISDFFSIIVANTFLYVAYLSLSIGVLSLVDIKFKVKIHIAIFALFLISMFYFTYVDYLVLVRAQIYNASVLFIIGYTLYYLFKADMQGKEIMTYVLILLGFSIILRGLNLIIFTEETNNFLSYQTDPFFIVVIGLANLLILAGVLSLIDYRKTINLKESERSKSSLLSNLPGFAYRCNNDENWTMTFLSDGFQKVTGYEPEEVLNNRLISFEEIISNDYRDMVRNKWENDINNKTRYIAEYKIKHKEGKEIWILEQGIGIYDNYDNCIAIEGYISDIDARKKLEDSLANLSYRDYLTGLYNKRYIEEELKRLKNSRNVPISIIIGDINGLKFINDSFGHEYGDELIKNVGLILKESLRDYELISRTGGDEYLIILENTSKNQVVVIIDRIQKKLSEDKFLKMGLSVSFGHATKEIYEDDLEDILTQAEDMMYRRKLHTNPFSKRNTVNALLNSLFEKDVDSETHAMNVGKYSKMLAEAAGLNSEDIQKTETAALLHDVGKVNIDEAILHSKTVLSNDEYSHIKKHSEIGYRILHNVKELQDIADIILCHHERIDGKGYPNAIKGEEIPYISRIISICDAFDSMVNSRTYKKPLSFDEAFNELRNCAGNQFDANLVELFITEMKK